MGFRDVNELADRFARGVQYETIPVPRFVRSADHLLPGRLDEPLDIRDATFHAPPMLGDVAADGLDLDQTRLISLGRVPPSLPARQDRIDAISDHGAIE